MIEKQAIDTLWVLVCSVLVFTMQAGFACLESGLTRAKNTINVAIKNLTDFGISSLLFWAFGFGLMFGKTSLGIFGSSDFFLSFNHNPSGWFAAFFLFELVFCSTATTIVSGAVAERMRFLAYIAVAAIVSGLIYPVFGHWAWNSLEKNAFTGWLANLGFRDFAGSTVVHSLAGWVSLAAVLIMGPRQGRFSPNQPPRKIHGHDIPVSVLGVFLLWFGWLGFNGGSTLGLSNAVSHILTNTILAGASGMVVTLLIGWSLRRLPNTEFVINGSLAGCVAITASCYYVGTSSSIVIGAAGGIVMLATSWLLERLRIDDAVDAIPVHLGAGAWGTLAVALFGRPELINTGLSRLQQLGAQMLGIAACGLWTFGVSYLIFRILNRFLRLRVTAEEEYIGLNISEHGATTELLDFFRVMEKQSETGDLSLRAPVEPFTETGQVAQRYNRLMDTLEKLDAERRKIQEELKNAYDKLRETQSQLIQSAKMATVGQLSSSIAHEIINPLAIISNCSHLLKIKLEKEKQPDTEKLKRSLDMIEDSVRRCKNIAGSLLDFSHTAKGLFQPISVNTAIENVINFIEYELKSENILIQKKLSPDLPNLLGDSQLLQQVIFDLIANARWAIRKKSQREGGLIIIASSYETQSKNILICVSDTGIGIPEENLSKIFEPFFTTKPVGEGTGLGLSIVSHIIKEHNGAIEVESQVNKGATFKILLPVISQN